MDSDFAKLARRQLSPGLIKYMEAARTADTPRGGWLSAIRNALEMSSVQLARRMNIAHPGITRMESSETDGNITLATLRKAASAMGCDLVYAIVPRINEKSLGPMSEGSSVLDALLQQEARRLTAVESERVNRTMALEDQALPESSLRPQLEDRAAELAANPRLLWDQAERFLQKPTRKKKSGRPKRA